MKVQRVVKKKGSTKGVSFETAKRTPDTNLRAHKTTRMQTRHDTYRELDRNMTKRQAQRQMTKRSTAKANAASRASLYTAVSASEMVEDTSNANAAIAQANTSKSPNNREISPANPTVKVEPPKEDSTEMIEVVTPTKPGTNPELAEDTPAISTTVNTDRGMFETNLYR